MEDYTLYVDTDRDWTYLTVLRWRKAVVMKVSDQKYAFDVISIPKHGCAAKRICIWSWLRRVFTDAI